MADASKGCGLLFPVHELCGIGVDRIGNAYIAGGGIGNISLYHDQVYGGHFTGVRRGVAHNIYYFVNFIKIIF